MSRGRAPSNQADSSNQLLKQVSEFSPGGVMLLFNGGQGEGSWRVAFNPR